jgi:hypothetical protein
MRYWSCSVTNPWEHGRVVSICIIGDSHIGALRLAWNRLVKENDGIEIAFFAAAYDEINGLQPVDGRLVADNDNLRELLVRTGKQPEIAATYDVYVLCGMHLENRAALRVYRMEKQKKKRWPRKRRIRKVIRALRDSAAIRTLTKLRQCTRAPAILIGTPYQPDGETIVLKRKRAGEGAQIKKIFDKACNMLAAEAGASFLPQPKETIAPGRTTTLAHLRHSKGGDNTHMNADYGVIVMLQILKAARDATGMEPPAQSAPVQSAGETA